MYRSFNWNTRNLKKPEEENVQGPSAATVTQRAVATFTTIGRRRKRRPEPAPAPPRPAAAPTPEPEVAVVEVAPSEQTAEWERASTYASSSAPTETSAEAAAPAVEEASSSVASAPEEPATMLPPPPLEPQRSLHETRYFVVEREAGLQYHGRGGTAAYACVVPVSKVEHAGRGRLVSARGRVVEPCAGAPAWIDLQVRGTVVAREVTRYVLAEEGALRLFRVLGGAAFYERPDGARQHWHARRPRAVAGRPMRAPAGAVFLARRVERVDERDWIMVHENLWLPAEDRDGMILREERACEGGWFVPVLPAAPEAAHSTESEAFSAMSAGYTTPSSQMSEGSEHSIMRRAHREGPRKGDCALLERGPIPMTIMERGESKVQPTWEEEQEEWEIGL